MLTRTDKLHALNELVEYAVKGFSLILLGQLQKQLRKASVSLKYIRLSTRIEKCQSHWKDFYGI
jgi:hypothetical protein